MRHLDLPGAGKFALITLDNGLDHTKPTTFGPQALANLDAAIDQVEQQAAAGSIAASASPASRSSSPSAPTSRASRRSRTRDEALDHRQARPPGRSSGSRTLAVPTFAFFNGAAMGGGVEIGAALHTTARSPPRCPRFSLPEVFLGLVPGWGGCALLPHLIGAGRARSPSSSRTR